MRVKEAGVTVRPATDDNRNFIEPIEAMVQSLVGLPSDDAEWAIRLLGLEWHVFPNFDDDGMCLSSFSVTTRPADGSEPIKTTVWLTMDERYEVPEPGWNE